jgi:capsular polysaccharide biosynthesis protein
MPSVPKSSFMVKACLRRTARTFRRLGAGPLRFLPGSSESFGPPRGITPTAEGWLRAHPDSGRWISLGEARPVRRRLPLHADPEIRRLFEHMGNGTIKRRGVADLRQARFWGNAYGCTLSADDRILHDLSPTFADFDRAAPDPARHEGLFQFRLPPVRRFKGTLAAINTYGHENFHHWLLDTVPAFGLLREAGIDFASIDGFLLRSSTKAFNREVLERLGIPEAKVVATDPGTHLRPDRLVVPTFSEPGRQPEIHDYSPEGLRFVRSLFLDGRTPSPVDADKIVVNRDKALARRLVNGDRIHERLRREGYVAVYLEDLTVAQQAALFQRVKSVIMPTGGGLANMAFANPGTKLIELFSPAYLPTFCLPLCQALAAEYVALVGRDNVGVGHSDLGNLADIEVPEEHILEFALAK